jgi:hypothetical protein
MLLFSGLLTAMAGSGAPDDTPLRLLYTFRTEPYGFTPDDVAYSPGGRHLLFSASGDRATCGADNLPGRGIYKLTATGGLVEGMSFPTEIAQANLGYGIATARTGRVRGNVYLPEFTGTPDIRIWELDRNIDVLRELNATGTTYPGDGIAYDPIDKTLMVVDLGGPNIFQINLDGIPIGTPIATSCELAGLTHNTATRTFFGVCWSSHKLLEIDSNGVELRSVDLARYGIEQPVGIAAGQGKLFIADEGDCNNQGVVYVFRSPKMGSNDDDDTDEVDDDEN